MEKSTFEALGGSYIKVGDYLFPYLIITDSTPLGKWGQLRKQYLKEHRPALYSSMLRMDRIVAQLHKQEGITESLKSSDQMEWVRRANSIQLRAKEIVLHELVYC